MSYNFKCLQSVFIFIFCLGVKTFSQNPSIKCYFNFPVNQNISTGTYANYLNGSFPDTIAAYINRAKFSVDVALYNYTSTATGSVAKIATAINNAWLRGVVIRWIYNGSSTNSGLSLLIPGINTLASPTTTGYGIMHNKFIAIDANSLDSTDAFIITGSYNFSSAQTFSDYNNLLIINSKNVAQTFYNEFNKMWGSTGLVPNVATSRFGPFKSPSAQKIFNVNGTVVEVYFSPKDNSDIGLENAISTANHDLFFGIYTFTANSVANLIKYKINNGIITKGIIDQFSQTYSPYSILSPVMGNNLKMYNGNGLYHNKIMLVDAQVPGSDPMVCTGSYNWSNAGAQTNDENMIIVHDSTIANEYLQSLCQNFTDLGGTPCLSGLPLTLINFSVQTKNNTPCLIWEASKNDDIDYFVVEKSTNGISFEDLKNVAKNNSSTYKLSDENNTCTTVWYRLRIVIRNSTFDYSPVVMCKLSFPNISVYPNPVKDHLNIRSINFDANYFEFVITDIAGKVITKKSISSGYSKPQIINTSQLIPGHYILQAKGKYNTSIQFIKEQ